MSTKNLARQVGAKTVAPCKPDAATRHTGYQVGGTSPFGTRKPIPVFIERTILDLPVIYINGGSRGFLLGMAPGDVVRTRGFFLSSNSGWPSATRSPGPTSIVGLRPWVSRPSAATRVTAGAASMRGAGSPASGRSSPLELL